MLSAITKVYHARYRILYIHIQRFLLTNAKLNAWFSLLLSIKVYRNLLKTTLKYIILTLLIISSYSKHKKEFFSSKTIDYFDTI